MRHFITGGSGFFGLHLIEHLLRKGEEVMVFDTAVLDDDIRSNSRVRYIKGDVRDREALASAMQGCDVVHHNAAVLPISRSGKVFREVNVQGTQNLLEAALANRVKKVINVSTSAVYGIPKVVPITEETSLNPLGDYGHAKFEAEELCRIFRAEHDLDISIVRPRTIIGAGRLGIFGILFDWIRRGKRVYIIGGGDNLFQFVSARDLAHACTLMTVQPCRNEDFNIGAEEYGTVKGDLEALIVHAGTSARVQPVNAFLVRNVLRVLDIFRLSPLVDWHYKTPHKPFYFDITKAKTMLSWQPQDSNISAFKDTYDWYIQNFEKIKHLYGITHRKSVRQGILKLLRF